MRKFVLSFLICLLSGQLMAQVGANYPAMSGDNLKRQTVKIPVGQEVSLIALAYSPKSEEYLKAWRKPLMDLFVQAPGTDLFAFEPYEANLKFVVLLTGAKKMGAGKVKSKMEENVEEHWKEHIVIVKGKSLNDYAVLDLGRSKADRVKPYFFLMDKSGKIVYATSGAYTSAKQNEIEEKLQELLGDSQFQD